MARKISYTDEFVEEAEDRPGIVIEVVAIALVVIGFVFWQIWKMVERGG